MMVPTYLGGQGQGAQVVHQQVLGGIGFGMQIWRKR